MSFNKRKIIFPSLFILLVFTRFFRLGWDNSFSFHPDENNMALSVLQMSPSDLNPNFFAYGQFPLYLTFFTAPKHDLITITLTLRFWSAVFSVLSVIIFYFISRKIFSSSTDSIVFCLFLIFTPGLIQTAHFGTTESILIFVFAFNLLFSFLIYDRPQKNIYLFFSSLVSGIGLATKISALILTTPVFFSLFFLLTQKYSLKNTLVKLIFFLVPTLIFGLLFSPFNLIDYQNFISSVSYEIAVANGSVPVFYTRQFVHSISYLFQLKNIFPYTNGLFVFIFSLVGFCFLLRSWPKNHKSNIYLLITLFSSLIYFIYQGQLFVKWTRFMSPIFFISPLLSIFFIQKIKNKFLNCSLVVLAIIPGIYFMKIYFQTDTRILATNWISQNIPENSYVLSESGNVVNLPVFGSQVNVNNFDFYTLDENKNSNQDLNQQIQKSDYIFIPSRRVFANQNNSDFPFTQKYYQDLFSGRLGFREIKTFSSSNSLFLNSENAEETWSVFDNPVVRIYQKQHD